MRRLPLLFLLLLTAPAWAEPPRIATPRDTMTLLADSLAVAPGGSFRLALHQVLKPGWHSYWTNPGDAGQPPEVTLHLPPGATSGALRFPAPERLPYGPLVNFGFAGTATFILPVTVPADARPGEDFTVDAQATWMVCERICVPEEGRFRLTLPIAAAAQPDPATAAVFAVAEAAEPRPGPFAAHFAFAGSDGVLAVSGPGLEPGAVRDAFFFPAAWGVTDSAAPQPLSWRDGQMVLGMTRGGGDLPARLDGVLAVTDGAGNRTAWTLAAAPGAVPAGGPRLWQALLLALAGGALLNLMPCVFPVLAMKAMALVRLGGQERAAVRFHALAYVAGVVLSFLALGGVLVGLRGAGAAAGWGFQFTQPAVVAVLAWLMLAVGLNLSGVFAVGGPVGLGARAAARPGLAGAFATGVLAVLVATPCTAPFMATAVGVTLALPAAATLAVFAALGLGLAAPYALLALVPGLAALLPRPGTWMQYMREVLAFPMYAAAAWLAWVLAQLAGPDGVLAALAGGVLVGFGAWAVGLAQREGAPRRLLWAAGGAACLAALGLLTMVHATSAGPGAPPWSEARLAALRAEGKPVFVNLTAAWCVTCKVNERVALDTTAVRDAFAARGVVVLVGDWTRADPAITALLRAHGRDGVPLYLLYPAGGGPPAVLPQLLTEGIVLRALKEAG